MKILLIDDDNLDAFITQRLLSLDHEVTSFTAFEEAITWAATNQFDIALIDYYLDSGVKGPDVLRKLLLHKGQSFKAFLLTNYIDQHEHDGLKKAGFAAIIEKPFTIEKFRAQLV